MRKSGILMPIFSLPSNCGIGTLGKPATDFVDFLKKSGQKIWQVLPLTPVDRYNSPYMSPCLFAGNTLFIDFDLLTDDKLLKKGEYKENGSLNSTKVNFKAVKEESERVLKLAFSRFRVKDFESEYSAFLKKNSFWLEDFAAFCNEEKGFCEFKQFIFYKQWKNLKKYANKNGIEIIGDLPIYPTKDSSDVLYNKDVFKLNFDGTPSVVSGTPPDAFSSDGQLWGSPVYDFEALKKQNPPYRFWIERLKQAFSLFDTVRIDHFRAFSEYYEIPVGKTPKEGTWQKGGGMEFFAELEKQCGKNLPVIAEDLGLITDDVKDLLNATGFAGMKVLQFAFQTDFSNPYLPENYQTNCVAYVGTHDNPTAADFLREDEERQKKISLICPVSMGNMNEKLIKWVMSSAADRTVFTMQDILSLGEKFRINTPGTKTGNWQARIPKKYFTDLLAEDLKYITEKYER